MFCEVATQGIRSPQYSTLIASCSIFIRTFSRWMTGCTMSFEIECSFFLWYLSCSNKRVNWHVRMRRHVTCMFYSVFSSAVCDAVMLWQVSLWHCDTCHMNRGDPLHATIIASKAHIWLGIMLNGETYAHVCIGLECTCYKWLCTLIHALCASQICIRQCAFWSTDQ